MTSEQLLTLLARRWYVLAIGAILTLASILAVRSSSGLYESRVDVLFLIPQSARYPNNIQHSSGGVIAMAGLVETAINGTRELPASSSSGVTMSGRGIEKGSTVTLPDVGGQWAHNFSRAVLTVEAVGPSDEWVRNEIDRRVRSIQEELDSWQTADRVRESDLIGLAQSPVTPEVVYSSGHPLWAAAAIGGLGGWLSVLAAVASDGILRRRYPAQSRLHE